MKVGFSFDSQKTTVTPAQLRKIAENGTGFDSRGKLVQSGRLSISPETLRKLKNGNDSKHSD